jgi:hypothetical protein
MTLKNLNLTHKEIKSKLNSGNACYNSVQNLLPFIYLSMNILFKSYETVMLPVVLHWCETCSLTFKRNRMGLYGLD